MRNASRYNIFQILGSEAQITDVVKQSGQAACRGRIQEDQPIPRVNQMGTTPEVAGKIRDCPQFEKGGGPSGRAA